MIKLLAAIKRRPDLAVAEFQTYWRSVHAPLVAAVPGLRLYVQAHAIVEAYESYPQAYDGVAELWFDSLEAWQAARSSHEWEAVSQDVPTFIGEAASLLARDVAVIDGFPNARDRQGMVKYCGFLTRLPHLSVEEFQRHWRDVHAPLVVAEYTDMRRYVQSHALRETYGSDRPPAYDGVPQAWFDSLEAVPGRLRPRTGPATTAAGRDSETVFVQPIPAMLSREIVIVD